jgi:hypothetical protein
MTTSRYSVLLLLVGLLAFTAEIARRFETRKGPETGVGLEWGGWMGGDGIAYRATVRGLVDQFTVDPATAFPEGEKYNPAASRNLSLNDSNRALCRDGTFLPSRSLVMPVVLIPFYFIFREYGLLLFNLLQCLLLLWLVFLFHRHFFDDAVAAFTTLAWLADGILKAYAYNVSPDVFGCVVMLGGTVFCWKKDASTRAWWLGGALLGLSIWLRPSNALVGIVLLPAALESLKARSLQPALKHPLLAMAAMTLLWAVLNAWWFGNPLTPAYEHMVVIHNGVLSTEPHSARFNRPFWESLSSTFFEKNWGFFFTAPHWPLFAGLLVWWTRHRPAMAVVTGILTFLPVLLLVKYDFWNASSQGNRFMLFSSAISSVVIGVVAEKLGRTAAGVKFASP